MSGESSLQNCLNSFGLSKMYFPLKSRFILKSPRTSCSSFRSSVSNSVMICSQNLVWFGGLLYITPIVIVFVFGNNRSMKIFSILLERQVFRLKQMLFLI